MHIYGKVKKINNRDCSNLTRFFANNVPIGQFDLTKYISFRLEKKVFYLRPLSMPFTFSGQSCDARLPGAVNGQQRKPSHVALHDPEMERVSVKIHDV